MNKKVTLHDKNFVLFKTQDQINNTIKKIATSINSMNPINSVFIPVLNGSFMFTSDLCKELKILPEIQFIKVKSYEDFESSGKVTELIGLKDSLEGKTVFIIEDIVDTGITISNLYNKIKLMNPKEIYVVTLLFKPDKYNGGLDINILYGFSIANDFVVGYGMDYNELGRNLKEIYVLKE